MKTNPERQREILRSKALMYGLRERVGVKSVHGFACRFDELSSTALDTKSTNRWHRIFRGKQPLTARAINELTAVFPDAADNYQRGPFDIWRAMWGPLHRQGEIAVAGITAPTFDKLLMKFEAEVVRAENYRESLSLRHLAMAVSLQRRAQGVSEIGAFDMDFQATYRCVNRCIEDDTVKCELARFGVLEEVRQELAAIASTALEKTAG